MTEQKPITFKSILQTIGTVAGVAASTALIVGGGLVVSGFQLGLADEIIPEASEPIEAIKIHHF